MTRRLNANPRGRGISTNLFTRGSQTRRWSGCHSEVHINSGGFCRERTGKAVKLVTTGVAHKCWKSEPSHPSGGSLRRTSERVDSLSRSLVLEFGFNTFFIPFHSQAATLESVEHEIKCTRSSRRWVCLFLIASIFPFASNTRSNWQFDICRSSAWVLLQKKYSLLSNFVEKVFCDSLEIIVTRCCFYS